MSNDDIHLLTLAQLAQRIQRKEVSPVEVTEAYLDRIDSLDFKFNSFITVSRKEALQAAGEAEKEIAQGNYRGPMHGIPLAVKDQFWTKGIRTTGGSRILADFVPNEDATVISKLKQAGAVILGKTTLTEFAMGGGIERFGPPRNPWNLDKRTGGSSGGSGAATAAFLCATSLGEDTGGSIRWPATWCGLVGHRPSWGRVSRYGVMPGVWSMDQIGPITRTVEDCALTLQAIAGRDSKDRYTSSAPVPDYRQALNGEIKGLRVGVVKEMLHNHDVVPEVRDAITAAANSLGRLGAQVDEVSIPMTSHAGTISASIRVEAPTNYRNLLLNHLKEIRHDNRIGFLTNNIMPATAYYKALKLRELLRQETLEALENFDLLVTPTAGVAAQKIEPDPTIDSQKSAGRTPWLLTAAFSLANVPAASICCGFTSDGLPIGMQIAGRPFEEGKILNLAYAYEQANEWRNRKPQI